MTPADSAQRPVAKKVAQLFAIPRLVPKAGPMQSGCYAERKTDAKINFVAFTGRLHVKPWTSDSIS